MISGNCPKNVVISIVAVLCLLLIIVRVVLCVRVVFITPHIDKDCVVNATKPFPASVSI